MRRIVSFMVFEFNFVVVANLGSGPSQALTIFPEFFISFCNDSVIFEQKSMNSIHIMPFMPIDFVWFFNNSCHKSSSNTLIRIVSTIRPPNTRITGKNPERPDLSCFSSWFSIKLIFKIHNSRPSMWMPCLLIFEKTEFDATGESCQINAMHGISQS